MRTTVDISPDLLDRIRKVADDECVSFKEALSRVITRGLTAPPPAARKPYVLPKYNLGIDQVIDLRRVNAIMAEEDTLNFIRKFYPDQVSKFEAD